MQSRRFSFITTHLKTIATTREGIFTEINWNQFQYGSRGGHIEWPAVSPINTNSQRAHKILHRHGKAFFKKLMETCSKIATVAATFFDRWSHHGGGRHQAILTLLESSTMYSQEPAQIRKGIRLENDKKQFQDGIHDGHIGWLVAPPTNIKFLFVTIITRTKIQKPSLVLQTLQGKSTKTKSELADMFRYQWRHQSGTGSFAYVLHTYKMTSCTWMWEHYILPFVLPLIYTAPSWTCALLP